MLLCEIMFSSGYAEAQSASISAMRVPQQDYEKLLCQQLPTDRSDIQAFMILRSWTMGQQYG
jgi:hypothetical protein